jgi:hypothetical protein
MHSVDDKSHKNPVKATLKGFKANHLTKERPTIRDNDLAQFKEGPYIPRNFGQNFTPNLVELAFDGLKPLKLTEKIKLRSEVDLNSVSCLILVIVDHFHTATFASADGISHHKNRLTRAFSALKKRTWFSATNFLKFIAAE